LEERAKKHLQRLCKDITERYVGSKGNQEATRYFASTLESFGFQIEMPPFSCFEWRHQGTLLNVGEKCFHAQTSPYSLECQVEGPLSLVSTPEELERIDGQGRVILLKGDIAREPLMPKNFPFYNPLEHKRIIHLLENKGFKAVLTATYRNPEMAGGVYPFPLIEDGDFTLPSAYMTGEEGERLSACQGQQVFLQIKASRIPSQGCNVVARKGVDTSGGTVIFAHIDSKEGSPGAIDNAAGVTVLLLLGELLATYRGNLSVELTALNGEDYYSNPGEVLYLEQNRDRFPLIMLGINLDGVGYFRGNTAYSTYGCPPQLEETIKKSLSQEGEIIPGEPWYQGDHGLFLMNQRPALAITSQLMGEVLSLAHTPQDNLDIIDRGKLVNLARTLHALLENLARSQ